MSTTGGLEALAEQRGDGAWVIRAPRVGIYRGCPRLGARRGAGDSAGTLCRLNRTETLILPARAGGQVSEIEAEGPRVPVEYGQTLFVLTAESADAADGAAAALPSRSAAGLPPGCLPVASPIDGIFYRRPSPEAAPFAQVGDQLETGRTLGLIEAMKSFNAVTYGGPGLPARAVIVEARAADAAEVRQGDVLFVIRAE